MAKRSRRRRTQPISNVTPEVTGGTTDPLFVESIETYSMARFDSTTEEELPGDASGEMVNSWKVKGRTPSDIIFLFLNGKIPIQSFRLIFVEIISYIILVSWLFIQDNGNSKLDNMEGLLWFLTKLKYISLGALLILVIIILVVTVDNILTKKIHL